MGRRDTGTFALRTAGRRDGYASPPGDERSTIVFSGEITTKPRAWPRTESPNVETETFGDYVVQEQLGVGGMASVHRAFRRVAGVRQRVALKRLLPHAAEDPEIVRHFLDEGRLVSALRHRNIAEVYDVGCVGDAYFMAMELVAGPTLKQLARQCSSTVGLMPFPVVINLLTQICDALAYAHDLRDASGKRLGLVHRDVSPSNVVISSNGVVKLIDFGVAKTVSSQTQAGIIKGKLGYIAPEYLEGTLDRRADLWAVGVIAYELLTNAKLFSSDNDVELMHQIRTASIDPPSLHNPDVPPELDAIVLTALERDPDRRWQNAAAMRNALVGVARPSTNAEVIEWVSWVLALKAGAPRPVRSSKRLPAIAAAPAVRVSVPLPLRALPTPAPLVVAWQSPVPTPPPLMLEWPTAAKPIGAAMLARRKRGPILLPLLLILLGGVASALAVPLFYELMY